MDIKAKLKGDKEARIIGFNGHGETDPERVKEVFQRIHPEGEFFEVVTPGLDRATGRILDHAKGEQSTAPVEAISQSINDLHHNPPKSADKNAAPKEEASQ